MAITRITAEQIAAGGQVDRTRLEVTTEADIRRHMIEDGEDPDAEPHFERPVLPQELRRKLGLSQTLLKLIDREPEAAQRRLTGAKLPLESLVFRRSTHDNRGYRA
jgi:putative transcriptional regulator